MAQDCRIQQGPGEQVDVGKIASSGWAVEAGSVEDYFAGRSKTGTRKDNRVQRAVQLDIGVADGRGSEYTEGEGYGSRKHFPTIQLFS